MPHTSSVTGCSTCRRVFISRKKNVAVLVQELDGAGVGVAAGLGHPTAASPMRPADLGSGRPGAGRLLDELLVAALAEQSRSPIHTALPWVSAKTCISTWRGQSR